MSIHLLHDTLGVAVFLQLRVIGRLRFLEAALSDVARRAVVLDRDRNKFLCSGENSEDYCAVAVIAQSVKRLDVGLDSRLFGV
jgi:hypothetical protein